MPDALLPVLQSGFDVSVPETSTLQYVIGTVVLIALVIALTLVRTRISYWGLPAARKRVREAVRGRLEAQTPAFAQFPGADIRDDTLSVQDVADEIAALLATADVDHALTRRGWAGTLRRIRAAVGVEWYDRLDGIPAAVLLALRWAVLVSLFGAVVVSTAVIVSYLGVSPDYPTTSTVVERIVSTAADASAAIQSLLGRYPYAGAIWALAFAYSILVAEWLYEHWYALPSVLVATGAAIWILQDRLDETVVLSDLPDGVLGRPRTTAALALGILSIVWAIGAGIATLGAWLGTVPLPAVGPVDAAAGAPVVGLVYSLLVGAAVTGGWLWWAFQRWRRRLWTVDAGERTLATYLFARRALTLESTVAAGLVVLYFVAGVVGGDFAAVGEAFLAASLEVKAGVGVAVLALLAVVTWQVRAAWPTVRSALSARFGQSVTKGLLVLTSLPWFALVVFYLLAWAVTQRVVLAIGLAVVAGLILRRMIRLGLRATHAARVADIYQGLPTWVGARVYELDLAGTADQMDVRTTRRFLGNREKREAFAGDIDRLGTQYLADVEGHRLAHPDRDELVREAARAVVDVATGDDPDPSVGSWHARFLVDNGIVDPEETREKIKRRAMKRTMALLRSEGPQVPRSRLDERLDPYPEDLVDERLSEAWYIRRDDSRVVLREDVPAKKSEADAESRLRALIQQ